MGVPSAPRRCTPFFDIISAPVSQVIQISWNPAASFIRVHSFSLSAD
jgi:hypothetical protein